MTSIMLIQKIIWIFLDDMPICSPILTSNSNKLDILFIDFIIKIKLHLRYSVNKSLSIISVSTIQKLTEY